MNQPAFHKDRLVNKGNGFYVYSEPRNIQPISRKRMAALASGEAGIKLVLLYRNTPDTEIRNYVLQDERDYERDQSKKQKS